MDTGEGRRLTLKDLHGQYTERASSDHDDITHAVVKKPKIENDEQNGLTSKGEDGDVEHDPATAKGTPRLGSWSDWIGSPGQRTRHLVVPKVDWDSDSEMISPIPCDSIENLTYTVVCCHYTSRIRIEQLPNCFWARDGLWGPDQKDPKGSEHIRVLQKCKESANGSFVFQGLADMAHLMEFEHCGCFDYNSMIAASLSEFDVDGKTIRILKLKFDTESG